MIPQNIGIGNVTLPDRLREFQPLSLEPSLPLVPIVSRNHVAGEDDEIRFLLVENCLQTELR